MLTPVRQMLAVGYLSAAQLHKEDASMVPARVACMRANTQVRKSITVMREFCVERVSLNGRRYARDNRLTTTMSSLLKEAFGTSMNSAMVLMRCWYWCFGRRDPYKGNMGTSDATPSFASPMATFSRYLGDVFGITLRLCDVCVRPKHNRSKLIRHEA
eukprot:4648005-Pyramimonas_sp.AAC.2